MTYKSRNNTLVQNMFEKIRQLVFQSSEMSPFFKKMFFFSELIIEILDDMQENMLVVQYRMPSN